MNQLKSRKFFGNVKRVQVLSYQLKIQSLMQLFEKAIMQKIYCNNFNLLNVIEENHMFLSLLFKVLNLFRLKNEKGDAVQKNCL